MREISLKTKLSISYGILISIMVISLLLCFLIINFRMIARDNQAALQTEADNTASKLSLMLREMDTVSTQVVFSSELQKIFMESLQAPQNENYFNYHMEEASRARNILVSINSPKVLTRRISVYNSQKNFITVGTVSYESSKIENGIQYPYWTELAVEADGKAVITPPVQDPWLPDAQSEPVIILARCLFSTYGGYDYLGIIEVQQSYRHLTQICSSANPNSEILVFDQNQAVIYQSQNLSEDQANRLMNMDDSSSENSVAFSPVGSAGWMVAVSQSRQNHALIARFMISLLLLTVCLIFITFLITRKLSARIARPLTELTLSLERASKNYTLGSKISLPPSQNQEELIRLNESFERMLQKIDQSMTIEMQARTSELHTRYFALTVQMEPHFLFNTLSLINAEAYEHQVPSISNVCERLCEMLRYASSLGKNTFTSLQNEIRYAENYMELYCYRYEENFSYSIVCPESLYTAEIPRMLIQPFIENCFKHAFSSRRPPWYIELSVASEHDWWIISISDNGGGFPSEKKEAVFRELEQYSDSLIHGGNTLEIGGLSIKNIYTRLRLLYGDEYSFDITSNEWNGTTVILSAPFLKGGKRL